MLEGYKGVFIALALTGILLFASPTIAILVKLPSSQGFSELYLLGPDYTLKNIPVNIKDGVRYLIYLGLNNALDKSSFYTVNIKFGNQNESIQDQIQGLPSSVPALYEYKIFMRNGETWQTPLTFQIDDFKMINNSALISTINLNGIEYSINKTTSWDNEKSGYYYTLIIELWVYNKNLGIFEYNNRFVSLRLNMTYV